MGNELNVGDRFYDYENIRKYASVIHSNGWARTEDNRLDLFSNLNAEDYAPHIHQGMKIGGKVSIYVDNTNGSYSLYTNEYKPKNYKNNKENPAFTVIYDWGEDESGKKHYQKAVDRNGNGKIDNGEITNFSSFDDLFNE